MNRRPIRPEHSVRTALATTIVALSALQIAAFGQAFTFTLGNLDYDENFDSMGATGTTFVPGWTSTDATMVVGAGGSNAGGIYNVGSAGSGERAFGSLGSGTNVPFFGASFLNSTGSQIVTLELSGFMEMWRSGSMSLIESQVFEFSLDATSLSDGTWTPVSSMNLVEPATAPNDNVAKDGNLPENRAAVSSGVSPVPVSWADSTSLWIRWKDNNDAGNDALLAVDDFSMTVTLGLPPKDLLWTPTTAIWDSVATNWKNTGNNNIVAFANGDTVTFDSTGLVQSDVQVAAGGVSPSTMTVNVGTLQTYRISGGAIGANTPLQKQGVGTLELGSVYAGGLNAAAGTVRTLANEV
ncbi:MAG TPA: hypothetical protein VFD27_03765, partial [Chthoniobacteraceae bacterium]|nr:hypothetical protein [Chthoniobacteraceae bacterium]